MTRTRERSGYLPSLDGWRCLAIVGVMLAHDKRYVIAGHSFAYYQGMGGYGVELFFAISGVLIAWRIMEDEKKTGSFSLKSFYIRRFFRIQPPQWVYLAVVGLLMAFHVLAGQWKYWLGALLLYENFLWHNLDRARIVPVSYMVGHFWTLAVEEHFYLLISLFFFLVKRRRVQILGLIFAVLVFGQFMAERFGYYSFDVSDRRTYWIVQYLLFAAWTALLLRKPAVMDAVKRWLEPWVAFVLTLVILYSHHIRLYGLHGLRPKYLLSMDQTMLFYCFTGWVVATMLHPASWTTRFLELRPLRFMGRISYSIYLWHLFLFGGGAAERCSWHLLTLANQWTVSRYGFSIALATLSYYFIEKPMIRLGHRLAPPATPGHRDLAGNAGAEPDAEMVSAGVPTSA